MHFIYADLPTNTDIYLIDNPNIKVRATFMDGGDVFVYCTEDASFASYINQVIDPLKKPHIYFASNLKMIEDEEQFNTYARYVLDSTNYQAQHKGEKVDGGDWTPTFTVQSSE